MTDFQATGLSRRDALRSAATLPVAALTTVALAEGAGAQSSAADRVFARGNHMVSGDTTLTGSTRVESGARVTLAAGATLTIVGDFEAPTTTIFSGPGRVDLSRSRLLAVRPEWWGAVADDPRTDSHPGLTAALAAHPAIALGSGSYFISQTWEIDRSDRQIHGIGGRSKDLRATRIVLVGATGTVVRVGTERDPGGINASVTSIDMRRIELVRSLAPRRTAVAATGLRLVHVLNSVFEDIRANEHEIGFSMSGVVHSFLRDCAAFRSITNGAADESFVGFALTEPAPTTGANNASIYLIDCLASLGNAPKLSVSIGMQLQGAFADTHVIRLETSAMAQGIVVDGRATTLSRARQRSGHLNLLIDAPVLDGCGRTGISVSGLAAGAAVEVRSPYIALSATGSVAIAARQTQGAFDVIGGQAIGWPATDGGVAAIGLELDGATGVTATRIKLVGFARPVVARATQQFDLTVSIAAERASDNAAIALTGCGGGYVRALLTGPHRVAVAADAASRNVTIDTAGHGAATVIVDGTPRIPGNGRVAIG